jgi:hypothetical protein
VVWFRCAPAADGAGGHRDLFGTLVRFVPLFDRGEALPEWAGGPRDGTVVFCTDADFADFAVERAMVALAEWLAERGGGRGGCVELATLSSGASPSPSPAAGSALPSPSATASGTQGVPPSQSWSPTISASGTGTNWAAGAITPSLAPVGVWTVSAQLLLSGVSASAFADAVAGPQLVWAVLSGLACAAATPRSG